MLHLGKVVEYIVELLLERKVVEYIGAARKKYRCRIGIRWSCFLWISLCGAGGILEKSGILGKVLLLAKGGRVYRCC